MGSGGYIKSNYSTTKQYGINEIQNNNNEFDENENDIHVINTYDYEYELYADFIDFLKDIKSIIYSWIHYTLKIFRLNYNNIKIILFFYNMSNIDSYLEKNNAIARISFIFVSFLVISGGYADQLLSCSIQKELKNNLLFKHIIGIGLIFMFIMLEGGWSFNTKEQNMEDISWSDGNSVDSLIYALMLYVILLLSAKTKLTYNITFLILLFLVYMINTKRTYNYKRNLISEEMNKNIMYLEKLFIIILPIILFIGVTDYYLYKKNEFGKNFSSITFFFGKISCNKK